MSITETILTQNFELIRDQIALIIGTEFASQKSKTENILFDAGIWVERFVAFDKEELPAIKVYYDASSFDKDSPRATKGESKFVVQVQTKSPTTSTSGGDTIASINAQKLVGAIRYIFEHGLYVRLGFAPGFIKGVSVTDIVTSVPDQGDSFHNYACNLVITVRHIEYNGLEAPTQTIDEVHSVVKLNDTEKGYKIVKI
jgi:hypothetical protein